MARRLANGTQHEVQISYWDKSQEVGNFEAETAVVTATISDTDVVNFTDQSGKFALLVTKMNAMVLGLPRLNRWVNTVIINANPAKGAINQLAVREIKLKFLYIDNTTQQRYECTIPTLDLSKVVYLPIVGNDAVSLSEPTAMTDLISAFQGVVVAPYTGNPVTIIAAEVVGRNN